MEELRINQTDLNTKRMLDLMAVSSIQGGSMPLYLHVVSRILRDLRIQQQTYSHGFNYAAFKKAIDAETLTEAQMSPLQQRLTTLESFMVDKEANSFDLFRGKFGARGGGRGGSSGGHKKKKASKGNDWSPKVKSLPCRRTWTYRLTHLAAQPTYHRGPIMPVRDSRDGMLALQHLPQSLPGTKHRRRARDCP